MPKASNCMLPMRSPRASMPTTAALMGSSTVKMPARDAGTARSPVIHSHTVQTQAARA
jgi:hypothetical protein